MYASYFYNTGATVTNIMADITAILTGTTDTALLSAACNKISTAVNATVNLSTWEVYDATAGANAVCFRAPLADDPAKYKFMVVDMNTSGYIITKLWDGWDAVVHNGTGKNMAYWSDSTLYCQRWPATGTAPNLTASMGGRLDISASQYHALFFSFQNSVFGSSTGASPSGIMERTRRSPWDTVLMGQARGYNPVVWGNLGLVSGTTAPFYSNILPNASGVDQFGGTAGNVATAAYMITPFGANTGPGVTALHQLPNAIVPNAVLVSQHLLIPFGCMNPTYGFIGGDISSLCDVWLATYNYGGTYDELAITGASYVIWTAGSYRIGVRKG